MVFIQTSNKSLSMVNALLHLLLLLLLTACLTTPGPKPPVPTAETTGTIESPAPDGTLIFSPTVTETPSPDAYPGIDGIWQGTRYPAPTEVPTLAPSMTPTETLIPTATATRPTPAFPPSLASLRIAFTTDKKLFIWFKGHTKLLTELEEETGWVSISSDGAMIAYMLSSELWVINADGTGKRLLVGKDRLQVENPGVPGKKSLLFQFKWIPNTHRLLLNTQVDTGGECCYTYNNDLHLVDADTLALQTLIPPGKAGDILNFSPNGKYVVLVGSSSINLLNLFTHENYNLFEYKPVAFPSEVGWHVTPIWSSDSRYLMVVVPPTDIHYGTELPSEIWKLPVNRQSPQKISTIGPEFGFVTLSPDFSKIVTERQISLEGTSRVTELHVANVDGSEDEIYHTGNLFFRGWSPDSIHFLYSDDNRINYLGKKDASPEEFPISSYDVRWLDGQTFLYHAGNNIRLGFLDGSFIELVGPALTPINGYDFTR